MVSPSTSDEQEHLINGDDGRATASLPNDILITILYASTMEEAARLSVLSREWNLWWSYYPRLVFDGTKRLHRLYQGIGSLQEESVMFVRWVNKVIMSHQGSTIEEFRVQFFLTKLNKSSITSWLKFAIRKNVSILDLNLEPFPNAGPIGEAYIFPCICRSNARLGRNFLKLIRLVQVHMTDKSLQSILSNCESLEKLYLVNSIVPVDLKVVGQSLKLTYLEVDWCARVKNIEISAIHLVSLKCKGTKINISLKNVPQLESLVVEDDFHHVQEQMSRFLRYPRLQHLKHLKLGIIFTKEDNLLEYVYLIRACPILCTFQFELRTGRFEKVDEELPHVVKPQWERRFNKHLKFVEFVGFLGNVDIDLALATYVIESSCMLEKVIFDTRHPDAIGQEWENDDYEEREISRERAKQLGKKLSILTNIVVI